LEFIGIYWNLLEFIGIYWNSIGKTIGMTFRIYSDSSRKFKRSNPFSVKKYTLSGFLVLPTSPIL
jgi:hypothetical protein